MLRPPSRGPVPAPRPAVARVRRGAATVGTVPFLARLRVGPKLMLLVLLPVTVLLSFTAFAAMAQWEEARTLSHFDTAIEVSFATSDVAGAVARERIAAVEARLSAGPDTLRGRAEAQRITDHALRRAFGEAVDRQPEPDVAGVLDAVRRQLHALRVQTGTGSLARRRDPAVRGHREQGARHGRRPRIRAPTRASGRAADAHMAMLRAVAATESERAELAILFHTPGEGTPPPPRAAGPNWRSPSSEGSS